MYVPEHFAERRIDVLHGLIDAHPLATLVRMGADGLEADHVPFALCETATTPCGLLRAHVARGNPLARQDGMPVLAVFQGPGAYVSPTVYDLEAADGRRVPTWNYAVVHAHGRLRVVDDGEWIAAHMAGATARREATNGTGWTMADAPPDYIARMVAATVGIEIAVERLEAKFKLSQNRPPDDRARVARATGIGAPA